MPVGISCPYWLRKNWNSDYKIALRNRSLWLNCWTSTWYWIKAFYPEQSKGEPPTLDYLPPTADLGIFRANNFYNNAVSGSSYSWDFDPAKESVTEGPEQVFYLVDAEGRTLIVTLKEINSDKIKFALDFTDSDWQGRLAVVSRFP